jgi:hypothetical protein
MSNTSTASIFIPIADKLAKEVSINPIYYLLPLTICVSFAFMMPFSSGPNAVVYGTGRLTVLDMVRTTFTVYYLLRVLINFYFNFIELKVKSGIFIKLFSTVILFAASNLWLLPIFPNNFSDQISNSTINNITKIRYEC